ncbi:MAG: acyl-CoA thioesterase [Gaiellales bacterium]
MTAPIEPGRKVVPIRWRDLDGFNHVNNAVFLSYLEEGRDAWLANALGQGITQMTEFVVRHIAIDFISQLTQEDGAVEVTVEVERVGTSSIALRETVTARSDGRVAARATGVLVHTNAEHTESRPLPDDLRARLEASLVD